MDKDVSDDVVVAGEDIRGHVGNFLHVLIFVHGGLDAEPDHLLGELAIAEEKIHEQLEFGFYFAQNLRLIEQFRHADTGLLGIEPNRLIPSKHAIQFLLNRSYHARIEAVTLDDANRAAKRLLDPDALSIVVVGKPVGL